MYIRILETIAASDFLTALECTEFVFDRGDPVEKLASLPRPPRWFKGDPTSKGRKGEVRRKGTPPTQISGSAPVLSHIFYNDTLLKILFHGYALVSYSVTGPVKRLLFIVQCSAHINSVSSAAAADAAAAALFLRTYAGVGRLLRFRTHVLSGLTS